MNLALDLNFAIPGDPGFPLNQVSGLSLACPVRVCAAPGPTPLCARCTSRPGVARTPNS